MMASRMPPFDAGTWMCRRRTKHYENKTEVFWLLFVVQQKVTRWPQDSGTF
jgi:hypothetical protein